MLFTTEANQIVYRKGGRTLAFIHWTTLNAHTIAADHTFVDELLRGQGVGKKLLDALAAHAAVMVTHDIDEALLVSDRIVLVGAGGRKAGEWQPETPFPRHGRLHDLSRLRGEIMQSLYHAQQDTQQAATVEFVI